MDRIRLGKNRIEVGRIGLGCMTMTGAYGAADPDEAVRAIHAAIDCGMTLLNTADFYGAGENERLIGRALKSADGDAVVSTKVGLRFDNDGRPTGFDGSPAHLAQACDASLKRLDVERIDIVILGRVDQMVPIEDSVGALSEFVAAGKAREIGLSEAASGTIRRANAVHPIAVLETEYSLWERGVEHPVLPLLDELDIALLAYRPLGGGFLAGAMRTIDALEEGDYRRHDPRFGHDNLPHNQGFADALAAMATRKQVAPAQLALAWLLHKGPRVLPIPGSKRVAHVSANAAAAEIVLADDEISELEAMMPKTTAGDRYPAPFMAGIDRD